jgi:DNA-binding MarR family transcriptional regulator
MDSYFFRVEHDLLRSEAFQGLGGSAIKVYLVIGLYSDFGTGWAYPSIRTIARQSGLSRQTVLAAVAELARAGLLATSKSQGRASAYRIIRQAPDRRPADRRGKAAEKRSGAGPVSLEEGRQAGPYSLEVTPEPVPGSLEVLARFFGPSGPEAGPKQETGTREDSASIPIPGTPFRLTAEGRLLVSVDLQELLTDQGLPRRLAERLASQRAPEDVAKVLLNALYLQSQGKLQNGPGYIRAGLEEGYDLLPQVATRLENRRRELQEHLRQTEERRALRRHASEREAEEAAVALILDHLSPDELQHLVDQAIALLPVPLVKRNPTLSNPFIRAKVYELAGGEPDR